MAKGRLRSMVNQGLAAASRADQLTKEIDDAIHGRGDKELQIKREPKDGYDLLTVLLKPKKSS